MINTYYSYENVKSILSRGRPNDSDMVDIFCNCCLKDWCSQEFIYVDGKGEVKQSKYIGESNFVDAKMLCPECDGEECSGINHKGFLTPHQSYDMCEKLIKWYEHRHAMDSIEDDLKDWNYMIVNRNFG